MAAELSKSFVSDAHDAFRPGSVTRTETETPAVEATLRVQDQASSVIYGMPAAVAEAGLADKIVGLGSIAPNLVEVV